MNLNLAAYYEPNGQEDLEKTAEAELFMKLAAEHGIDVNALSDEDVTNLYNYVFDKTAEEEPKDEAKKDEGETEDEDEKKEAAAREHQTKLAHARDMAHADELGKRMAHTYVAELNKIGSDLLAKQAAAEAGETDKEAGVKDLADKAGKGLKRGLEHVQAAVSKKHGPAMPPKHGPDISRLRRLGRSAEMGAKATGDFAKKHKTTLGVGAGAASVGAGAGYAAGRSKESSSHIDQLALEEAVKIAQAGGFDPEEAAQLVAARFTIGDLEESAKLASTLEEQVQIRALEYLESVGYPVTWNA